MDISLFFFNYYFKGTGQIQKLMGKRKKEKKNKGTIEESDKNKRKKKKKWDEKKSPK